MSLRNEGPSTPPLIPDPPIPNEINSPKHLVDELAKERNGARLLALNKILEERKWDFSGLTFDGHVFQGLTFANADFTNCTFLNCDFTGAAFSECFFDEARLKSKLNLKGSGPQFNDTSFIEATLSGSFQNAKFTLCVLQLTTFDGADLRNAVFTNVWLSEASFVGATVSNTTKFESINDCNGMKIDRYSLASLGDESGLTLGNKMDLKVVDDVATLRQEFGGVWAIAHLSALVIFLYPYTKFLLVQSARARFSETTTDAYNALLDVLAKLFQAIRSFLTDFNVDSLSRLFEEVATLIQTTVVEYRDAASKESITLLEAFARFIYNGGENWQRGWDLNAFSFAAFLSYLLYNFARGALLWKTKRLETQQEVSGFPAKFSLMDSHAGKLTTRWWNKWQNYNAWGLCYLFVQVMFWVALVSVVGNTLHFLMQRIPINS